MTSLLLEEVHAKRPHAQPNITREKTATVPKNPRPTRSPVIARHLQHRAEGRFPSPKQELHAIDRLADSGYLSPSERKWANARREELLRKIYNPTTKERLIGFISRGLDAEERERSGNFIEMKRIIKRLQKTLDIEQ